MKDLVRNVAVYRRQREEFHSPVWQCFSRIDRRDPAALLEIEQQGGSIFFGEPMLDIMT